MTPQEYVDFNNCKPLTNKELKKGKESLKIYNTDEPMPWTEVYTYITVGKSMVDIEKKYGHGRKIALWAIHDNVQYIPAIEQVFVGEIEQRRKMNAMERENPIIARTMLEMVNEYAPDAGRRIVIAASSIIDGIIRKSKDEDNSSYDFVNLSKALQTSSDTIEITQRHSAGIQVNNNHMTPTGFDFVLDEKEIIDVEPTDG